MLALAEALGRSDAQPGQGDHIELDHGVYPVGVAAHEAANGGHAGVVDQDRDGGVGRQSSLDPGQVRLGVEVCGRHLDLDAGLGAQASREVFQAINIAGDQDQVVATLGQAVSIDGADAGGRAGDQGGALGGLVGHDWLLQILGDDGWLPGMAEPVDGSVS